MTSNRARRRCCALLLGIACFGPTSVRAGELFYRMYGYMPRTYGYAPSAYVFPRYGFERGYVYVQGTLYGSPELGSPVQCRGAIELPAELPMPIEQVEAVDISWRSKKANSPPAKPQESARAETARRQ